MKLREQDGERKLTNLGLSDLRKTNKQTKTKQTNKNTFLVPFICQSIDYMQLFQQILTNFYLRIWANCCFNIAKFRNNMISMTIPSCYDNDNIDDDDNWVPDESSVDSSISVKIKTKSYLQKLQFVIGKLYLWGKNGKKIMDQNFEPQHLHSRKKK